MNYSLKIKLSDLIDIDITEHEGEQCVVIPIEKNGVYIGKRDVTIQFNLNEQKPNRFKQTHYVTPVWNKQLTNRMKELGIRLPIVGYLIVNYQAEKTKNRRKPNQGKKNIDNIDKLLYE